MASTLQNAIEFFKAFGLFDVVLPFLLVFTIIYAILEKTRILGHEGDDLKTPKRNLDAMVSFVVALLVVATNKVVTAINEALPNVVLLIVIFMSFLLMLGIFWKSEEFDFKSKEHTWYVVFSVLLFIGLIIVFLNALKLDSGQSWFEYILSFIGKNSGGSVLGSIIFLGIMIAAIAVVVRGPRREGKPKGG